MREPNETSRVASSPSLDEGKPHLRHTPHGLSSIRLA